ncbi:hypothetical protein FOA43_000109 [Brettanomyces nanus]|uniref:peptidylprolyl isomerase n=1 Tax=Eeniella nana TaxID=13502 RepID=A0A875RSS3_EENNA|nr:uncharacterized protein FOA43_000109 [Brettanomyces nanus]QPG72807.1 hypothetical protein FOA43_000109 [Brettanomyces nanus]
MGRIVIELFVNQAVNATDNFLQLCKSKSYKKTYFHRVICNFMVQGGNNEVKSPITESAYPYDGEKKLAKGGHSIFKSNENSYGDFKDENLGNLDNSFLVCMANLGRPNTNRSQFFITTASASHLNGKHTIVGKVTHGKSVVRAIEHVEVYSTDPEDARGWIPKDPVVVADCGVWNKDKDDTPVYCCCEDSLGGDVFEEYPDDNERLEEMNLSLDNPEQAYSICLVIKKSATMLLQHKRYQDSLYKYKKAMRYCNELLPDEEKHKEDYDKFLDLKKTLYLNLAFVSLQLLEYQKCIDYCGYLFEFINDNKGVKLTSIQVSKAFFRLGKAFEGLKRYTEALDALKNGLAVNIEDAGIKAEVVKVKKLKFESEKGERMRYARFFN